VPRFRHSDRRGSCGQAGKALPAVETCTRTYDAAPSRVAKRAAPPTKGACVTIKKRRANRRREVSARETMSWRRLAEGGEGLLISAADDGCRQK